MLENRLLEKERTINELKESLGVVKTVNKTLHKSVEALNIKVDDLEQYSRRTSIRIENIPYVQGETEADLNTKGDDVLSNAGVVVERDTISIFHHSGKPLPLRKKRNNNENEEDVGGGEGTLVAQTIVKFRHWGSRRQAHYGRKNLQSHGYTIRHDLTKRRNDLLNEARDRIKAIVGDSDATFAFVDLNCNLAIRHDERVRYFNTKDELLEIMDLI